MEYFVVNVGCKPHLKEIIEVELSEMGFDSFLENESGFEASMHVGEYAKNTSVEEQIKALQQQYDFTYHTEKAEKQNWNELWEQNFPHVEVSDDIVVKAPFHKLDKKYKRELVVMPKMSFGTGHHATTTLMLQSLDKLDCKGKKVVDIGSGTGILAILAMLKGAASAFAFDIEEWAVENAEENAELNKVKLSVQQGTIATANLDPPYQIALANINKNIILNEVGQYAALLATGGYLLTSGYFDQDAPDIIAAAERVGLHHLETKVLNTWCCITFIKKK